MGLLVDIEDIHRGVHFVSQPGGDLRVQSFDEEGKQGASVLLNSNHGGGGGRYPLTLSAFRLMMHALHLESRAVGEAVKMGTLEGLNPPVSLPQLRDVHYIPTIEKLGDFKVINCGDEPGKRCGVLLEKKGKRFQLMTWTLRQKMEVVLEGSKPVVIHDEHYPHTAASAGILALCMLEELAIPLVHRNLLLKSPKAAEQLGLKVEGDALEFQFVKTHEMPVIQNDGDRIQIAIPGHERYFTF